MGKTKRKVTRRKPDKRLASLSAEVFGVYAPPHPMDIVAWCERYRRLSPEASAEPRPYRISRAPFFGEVMRACVDPEVREVVVMGASQISKTEACILNVLAYKISNDPAPSLLVTSTLSACHSLSPDRFEPMVRDREPLRGLVAESGAPNSESTTYRKTFPDGHLTLVGSNSASGLARMPIRDLYLTEVDRFALEAGRGEGEGEGDAVSLARVRTSTFYDSKVIMESSPTIAGRSRIEAAYLNSTQEQVMCRAFYHPNERLEPVAIDLALTDREILPIAGGIEVIHTPGHCAGQVALLWRPGRMLFAGDACTNVMGLGDPVGFENLKDGGASQRKLSSLSFDAAGFGHGKSIARDASTRFRNKWGG